MSDNNFSDSSKELLQRIAELESELQHVRKNEEKYRFVLHNMDHGYAYHKMFLKDGVPYDYEFLEVNDAFVKLTGMPKEKWIGRKVTEILPGIEKDPANWIGKYGKVAYEGASLQFEQFSEALKKWYSVTAYSPERGFFVVIFSDVTKQVSERAEFEKLSTNFNLILNNAGEGIFEVDNKNKITFINQRGADLLGTGINDLIGHEIHEFAELQGLEKTELESYSSIDGFFKRKSGKKFPVSYVSTPIYEDDKRIRTVIIFQDISELKEAEKEQKRLFDMLEESNKELQQFAYIASHDLQEPLRMITSFLKLLEKRYSDAIDQEGQEFIYYAMDGASRMRQLINDILVYSRVETRGKKFKQVDMNNVLSQVLSNLKVQIDENNPEILSKKLPTLFGDESQLKQLLQNLIGNSIKFKRTKNPKIQISCENLKKGWIFAVSDDGIGIETKYITKIFNIFEKLHTSKEYPGTGIGLAICKRIVDRHKGRIWVDSQINVGSTFYFSIPKSGGL